MSKLDTLTLWFNAHPFAASLAALLLTAVVNWLAAYLTSERWNKLVESNPRFAAFLLLLKHAGFNPVGVVTAIRDMVSGKLGLPPGKDKDK